MKFQVSAIYHGVKKGMWGSGQGQQACRSTSWVYAVVNKEGPDSNKVEGKDQHPRLSSDVHTCTVAWL